MSNPVIIVVGSVNRDLLLQVEHLPRAGQTVTSTDRLTGIGGKGANQAVAAARLGAEVRLVATLGADGAEVLAELREHGVDTSGCRLDPGRRTGLAVVQVDAAGENMITLSPGGNAALTPADLPELAADVLLLQQEIPADVVFAAAERAHGAGTTVVLNPAPYRPLHSGLLDHVDVLVPNAGELGELLGEPEPATPDEAAALLLSHPLPCAVVVTLGAAGAVVAAGGLTTAVAAPHVDVVDTVGAGDTTCGALADALGRGADLVTATRWAVHAGALAVTGRGAQTAMPDRTSVRALLSRSTGAFT